MYSFSYIYIFPLFWKLHSVYLRQQAPCLPFIGSLTLGTLRRPGTSRDIFSCMDVYWCPSFSFTSLSICIYFICNYTLYIYYYHYICSVWRGLSTLKSVRVHLQLMFVLYGTKARLVFHIWWTYLVFCDGCILYFSCPYIFMIWSIILCNYFGFLAFSWWILQLSGI